ncbi:MAG TPA: hypothetical protein VG432_16120, partial [Gemmatimonadaceae bacterium]|nr:hypothetical protein [Gemmatimonadaceae bacterium]
MFTSVSIDRIQRGLRGNASSVPRVEKRNAARDAELARDDFTRMVSRPGTATDRPCVHPCATAHPLGRPTTD